MDLKNHIQEFSDFPKKGILFRDINPILKNPKLWKEVNDRFSLICAKLKPDLIVGIESRGFIIGASIATSNQIGFIPIRKPNKLPGKVIGVNYKLEYGEDRLEVQKNSIEKNSKIIVIDDLLATGGTASAAGKLIRKAGGHLIGYAFLVELTELKGRKSLGSNLVVESLIKY